MNANGDSDTDFTLLDCNPLTGDWNVSVAFILARF